MHVAAKVKIGATKPGEEKDYALNDCAFYLFTTIDELLNARMNE
jgi:hypothetical protein